MYSAVCLQCGKPRGCGKISCPFAQQQWKLPLVSFDDLVKHTLGPDTIVIGEPWDFIGDEYDKGVDLF